MDALLSLPACIRRATQNYQWTQVDYGKSGTTIHRLDPQPEETIPTRGALYLKFGTEAVAEEILAEAARLAWLKPYLPVPDIHHFCFEANQAWLLTTAVAGQNAYGSLASFPDSRIATVEAIAHFLRRFHSLPVAACPFNNDYKLKLIDARKNIDAHRVNEQDFDSIHEGWTAEQVWQELQTFLPLTADRVVAHGDFCLGNILIEDRKLTGCVDVGRTGAADRYQDLAILWNDLSEFGPDLQTSFLKAYGIATPDLHKLRFHLCLDELF